MSRNFTNLSTGVLDRINRGEDVDCPFVLQILGGKRIPSSNPASSERYRLVLNDGVDTHNFAMLAIPLNHLYEEGKLSEYTIAQIDRVVPSKVNKNDNNERQVLIIFEITPLHPGEEVGCKIETSKEAPLNSVVQQAQKSIMKTSSIADLSGHLTFVKAIKARVMSKSAIRTWSNGKGFSMDLCDETGAIRCTAFCEMVDRYYDMLEVDRVYYISKCQLKPANKQYSQLKNDYEMIMTIETEIQPCIEENSSIPKLKYNLVSINDLWGKPTDSIVDVIAICKEAGPISKFTSYSGEELSKREVVLIDQSNAAITLTLWGNDAETFNDFDNPVVFLKGAKLGEYNGTRNLVAIHSTVLKVYPDMTEGARLREWFENGGCEGSFATPSTRPENNQANNEWWLDYEAVSSDSDEE